MASSLLLLLLVLPGDLAAAEKALAAGNAEEAIRLLGDLVVGDDAPAQALALQGRALIRMRRYNEAAEPLMRAADALPEDHGLAYDAAYACWGSAEGPYAAAYLADAHRYAVRSGDPLLIGDISHARGDFEAALNAYRAANPTAERKLHVLTRIAECLVGLGKDEEAKDAYGEALEEAIRRVDLLAAYRAAMAAGRGGRLLRWLDERVAAQPENGWNLLYRGYAREALQQDENAAADLRLVAKLLPDQKEAQGRLALVLVRGGIRRQDADALRESEQVALALLREDPGDANAWQALSTLAWYAASNAQVRRAYELLREMREFDAEDENTALNFCAMARRLGRYDEARAVFEALTEANPYSADALVDYGILEDGLGHRDAALALWRRALEIRPRDLNAMENLYTDAWERGEIDAAGEIAARALDIARGPGGSPGLVQRWEWLSDRLLWSRGAPGG